MGELAIRFRVLSTDGNDKRFGSSGVKRSPVPKSQPTLLDVFSKAAASSTKRAIQLQLDCDPDFESPPRKRAGPPVRDDIGWDGQKAGFPEPAAFVSAAAAFDPGIITKGAPHVDFAFDEDPSTLSFFTSYYCAVCYEGGEIVYCGGSCARTYHPGCVRTDLAACVGDDDWKCPFCRLQQHPCIVCSKLGVDDAEVLRCGVRGCGAHYHPACLKSYVSRLPKRKAQPIGTCVFPGAENCSFVCPRHQCRTCGGHCIGSGSLWCFWCPAAVHDLCHVSDDREQSPWEEILGNLICCSECFPTCRVPRWQQRPHLEVPSQPPRRVLAARAGGDSDDSGADVADEVESNSEVSSADAFASHVATGVNCATLPPVATSEMEDQAVGSLWAPEEYDGRENQIVGSPCTPCGPSGATLPQWITRLPRGWNSAAVHSGCVPSRSGARTSELGCAHCGCGFAASSVHARRRHESDAHYHRNHMRRGDGHPCIACVALFAAGEWVLENRPPER